MAIPSRLEDLQKGIGLTRRNTRLQEEAVEKYSDEDSTKAMLRIVELKPLCNLASTIDLMYSRREVAAAEPS